MSDPYIGEIRAFGFNFAPVNWAVCAGQLLPISQNPALFSILGTQYGGNGTTNFALPNLQGNVPLHQGEAPGLTPRIVGETGGETTVTLTVAQIPAHTHAAACNSGNGTAYTPGGNVWATDAGGAKEYAATGTATMAASALAATGGNQPHDNMQPSLAINYCIALAGIFPPRG
jgi:microcystin-dependent protein